MTRTCAGTALASLGGMPHRCPVLLVEDDPANAKLIAIVLRQAGYNVRVTASAEAALAALEQYRPRLIVLDLILPLMSGLLLAARIRAEPMFADTVIVAVSAFTGCEIEELARDAGCQTFIRKPFDVLSLPDLVGDALRAA